MCLSVSKVSCGHKHHTAASCGSTVSSARTGTPTSNIPLVQTEAVPGESIGQRFLGLSGKLLQDRVFDLYVLSKAVVVPFLHRGRREELAQAC